MTFERKHQFRPEFEGLEDRRLPAGPIIFTPLDGTITVRGTRRADKLVVSYTRGSQVKVRLSGGLAREATVPRSNVTGIVFLGRGGRDRLVNRTSIPVTPPEGVAGASPAAKGEYDEAVALSADQLLILQQTNQYRQSYGLAPLGTSALLQQIAQAHADNLARQDRFGDTDTNGHILDGRDVVYRAALAGYIWTALGENVAFNSGYANPAQKLIDQWWHSAPHQAAILAADFTQVGLGVAVGASGRTYGVQVFARPA